MSPTPSPGQLGASAAAAMAPAGATVPAAAAKAPAGATVPAATALERALDRVGDRWSLLVVGALLDGDLRFGELDGRLPGIAPNILTDRLRRLERAGVIVAEPYSVRPLRVRYRLTLDGQELAGVLRLLASWGATHDALATGDDALATAEDAGRAGRIGRHEACGTPVEVRWYCPTCARVLGEEEPTELRYL